MQDSLEPFLAEAFVGIAAVTVEIAVVVNVGVRHAVTFQQLQDFRRQRLRGDQHTAHEGAALAVDPHKFIPDQIPRAARSFALVTHSHADQVFDGTGLVLVRRLIMSRRAVCDP